MDSMTWLVGVGVGVIAGAVIVALTLFHGRRGAGRAPPGPLDAVASRRLGYLPVGPAALRRLHGETPIVFEWGAGPVWRVAAAGDPAPYLEDPDLVALRGRLGAVAVVGVGEVIEVRGGAAADPATHLAVAELLVVLHKRMDRGGV